ncbi:thiosulfate oxidation carrier complex protein SoxZ [Amphritea sp. 1_MG-2023]|uniref:thiosulfate oxidation carrier complex protein SoxZ n=1 Tax=Amphritea sp. 1_MG-2023 TaxID=3062670 RepID=UPI0026E3AA5D|nr:thiosulfate oxidation carrier complex protein SoxZ [Amphritea sp. 1_MG-2023]MDO6564948.1 thiosulfate oxidation carrier complex protein SoxZ [Amphritea sp. 1_MG-2023]
MADIISVNIKLEDEFARVKLQANHPMQDGMTLNQTTGEIIPARFLESITVLHKDNIVFVANIGPAVSANPFLGFGFNGAMAGDELTVNWLENTGNSGSETTIIK